MTQERKPVIGITPTFDGNKYTLFTGYTRKIAEQGGIPLILPQYFNDVSILDGLIFSGGDDLTCALAGYEPSPLIESSNEGRDEFEKRMFLQAYEMGIPMLGICRGHQLLNVMLGGTLYRDIKEAGFEEEHMRGSEKGYHTLYTDEGTLARQFFGAECEVWSTHHQAVKTVGENVRITARSKEGIIEAIEHENGIIVGLQTHPERMDFTPPFEWFVKKAKEYARKKLN